MAKKKKESIEIKENKFITGNMGRPPHFATPELLSQAVSEYFENCNIKEERPTVTGLTLYLGFESRSSLDDYEKRNPEFSYIIKRARTVVEASYENKLYSMACAGAIFALKNMGWKDKSEVEQTVNTIKITPPKLRKKEEE